MARLSRDRAALGMIFNPSLTKGGGVEPSPKSFPSLTFENNTLETPNFAESNYDSKHTGGGYNQI